LRGRLLQPLTLRPLLEWKLQHPRYDPRIDPRVAVVELSPSAEYGSYMFYRTYTTTSTQNLFDGRSSRTKCRCLSWSRARQTLRECDRCNPCLRVRRGREHHPARRCADYSPNPLLSGRRSQAASQDPIHLSRSKQAHVIAPDRRIYAPGLRAAKARMLLVAGVVDSRREKCSYRVVHLLRV